MFADHFDKSVRQPAWYHDSIVQSFLKKFGYLTVFQGWYKPIQLRVPRILHDSVATLEASSRLSAKLFSKQ